VKYKSTSNIKAQVTKHTAEYVK